MDLKRKLLVNKKYIIVIIVLFNIYIFSQCFSFKLPYIQSKRTIFCNAENVKKLRFLLNTVTKELAKENVTYWVDYGTLLGAYRHRDIIPWDHDVDLGYLYTDTHKLHRAIQAVHRIKDFSMNTLKVYYKDVSMDICPWIKVNRPYSRISFLYYNIFAGDSNSENCEMNRIFKTSVPSLITYIRNTYLDCFPCHYADNRKVLNISDFYVQAPGKVTELLKHRYYISYKYEVPYCIYNPDIKVQ